MAAFEGQYETAEALVHYLGRYRGGIQWEWHPLSQESANILRRRLREALAQLDSEMAGAGMPDD